MRSMLRGIVWALGLFAAANLIALTALVAWLMATGRMDGERFDRLRRIVATTIESEREQDALAVRLAQDSEAAALERQRLSTLPRTASARLADVDEALDQAQIRRRMLEEEARLLSKGLDERLALLREQQSQLERSERLFDDRMAEATAERSDAQFRKTVQLLESAPPKQAKEWLIELSSTGRHGEAVRYLDSMSRFAASRLMRELKSEEETALAADLLEALRRRDLDAAPADSTAP